MKIRVRRRGTEQIRAQGRFFPGEPVVKVAIQVSADPQRPATGRRGYIVRKVVEKSTLSSIGRPSCGAYTPKSVKSPPVILI